VRQAEDDASAVAAVSHVLDELLAGATAPAERDNLYARIVGYLRSRPPVEATGMRKDDFVGAFTSSGW
jgi:hypothetical protein